MLKILIHMKLDLFLVSIVIFTWEYINFNTNKKTYTIFNGVDFYSCIRNQVGKW